VVTEESCSSALGPCAESIKSTLREEYEVGMYHSVDGMRDIHDGDKTHNSNHLNIRGNSIFVNNALSIASFSLNRQTITPKRHSVVSKKRTNNRYTHSWFHRRSCITVFTENLRIL
jgi:hypothetical protein